jgi:hypothetical protein
MERAPQQQRQGLATALEPAAPARRPEPPSVALLQRVQRSAGNQAAGRMLHRDLAVAPTHPAATATLSDAAAQDAITFDQGVVSDAAEIQLLRDVLGLSKTPAVIDEAFVRALASYQVRYGIAADGKLNAATRKRVALEILTEARFMNFTGLVGLAIGVELRQDLKALIDGGDRTYATYKARILRASTLQRDVVLADAAFLTSLKGHLGVWNDFAKLVETLGRQAPTYDELIVKPEVRAAVAAAWTDSDPAVNPPGGTQHEEGGWVYLNIITDTLEIRRQTAGATASIDLSAPPVVADCVVVAKFHTHPNLGPGWRAAASPGDATVDAAHGVPDIVVGTTGVDPAVFELFPSGPARRAHLAGNQGLPGASGGVAPQAKEDMTFDEQ